MPRKLHTCYRPSWLVHYNTTDYNQIRSLIESDETFGKFTEATEEAEKYSINTTSTCYYDRRNSKKAQWEKPNAKTPLIFMLVGIGVYVLFGILICWCCVSVNARIIFV
ncbi:unnamed protein product [Rotaria magnacalcarata]|nr:unnamed protein product [Rotaria magnacalcarata]